MAIHKTLKLLLVDDEPSVLEAITLAAELGEWDVRTAPDGEAAIAAVESELPDVVISDKNMPGINGVELLRLVRAKSRDVSFHIFTGFANAESVREAASLDVDGYVEKPIQDIFETLERVRRAHEKRTQRNRIFSELNAPAARKGSATIPPDDSTSMRRKINTLPNKRGMRAGAAGSVFATLAISDQLLRERMVSFIHTVSGGTVRVHATDGPQKVTPNASVIICDADFAKHLRMKHPHAFLATFSDGNQSLEDLIALTDAGIRTILGDAPPIEIRAQIAGFFLQAFPSLKFAYG